MHNGSAAKFVKQLIAVFCRYPVSSDVKEIYLRKLSKWRLSDKQWENALDLLITVRQENERELPELNKIYEYLKKSKSDEAETNNLGWAYFTLKGYYYAIRVKMSQGRWVIADLTKQGKAGETIHLQKNAGLPVVDHIPNNAQNYDLAPDNPARPDPREMPTPDEVKALIHQATSKLRMELK